MNVEQFKISSVYPQIEDFGATFKTFFTETNNELNFGKRPAIVIFPGGGYWFTSAREADPIALTFAAKGFQAIVVDYSTKNTAEKAHYPQQLLEGIAAIDYLRKHADELNIDPTKISVIGFSAGGHMAGMMGTLYGEKVVCDTFNVTPEQVRPDAMILSYAVLSSGQYGHRGSFSCLLGEELAADESNFKKVDIIENVTENTPPAFLWTSYTDDCVPPQNSLMMATKMLEKGVKCELHMFREVWHGASLADHSIISDPNSVSWAWGYNRPHVAHWVKLCLEWLDEELQLGFKL